MGGYRGMSGYWNEYGTRCYWQVFYVISEGFEDFFLTRHYSPFNCEVTKEVQKCQVWGQVIMCLECFSVNSDWWVLTRQ